MFGSILFLCRCVASSELEERVACYKNVLCHKLQEEFPVGVPDTSAASSNVDRIPDTLSDFGVEFSKCDRSFPFISLTMLVSFL